jgi:2-oxoisovalerate dehydrogenase E1 component alpha subunit
VIGTQIPHGVGAAFATKNRRGKEVHAIYFGDGATSSNGFHSGMNFAAVWKVPTVFVCIDNGWAISVPTSAQSAAALADKGAAYGVPSVAVDGNDALACLRETKFAVDRARAGEGPSLRSSTATACSATSRRPDQVRRRREAAEASARPDRPSRTLCRCGPARSDRPGSKSRTPSIDAEIHRQEAAEPMALATLGRDAT